jgi:AI-2 transport protein TqsA
MRSQSPATTVFLGIVATIMLGWVLYVGAGILQPLVIALLLAIMLQPIVRNLARVGIPPVLTVISLVGLLFFGAVQLGVYLESSLRNLFSDGQTGAPLDPEVQPGGPIDPWSNEQEEVSQQVGGWRNLLDMLDTRLQESALPEPFTNYVSQTLAGLDATGLAAGLIGGGVGFGKNLLLVVIYMLFIFAEQAIFRRKILSIAGDQQEDAEHVLDTIGQGIQRYLGVKTLISLVTGALCYAGLVALGVPWALLFGVLTFLLNYIPTFGSIIAAIFPIITVLAIGETVGRAAAVGVMYLSINLTLGSYVEPKILGRELDLSPLVIVLSVVVWGTLWGVVGAFLAVPITSAIQIVLASQENTRPLAVLLSSGPPRERWRIRGLAQRRAAEL